MFTTSQSVNHIKKIISLARNTRRPDLAFLSLSRSFQNHALRSSFMQREQKRVKMSTSAAAAKGDRMKIATHDGSFHCDEALGIHLLKSTEKFSDAIIVRTRDETVLSECDCVIDVGARFDVEGLRFDHHQKGFEEVFGFGFRTKLSSAGLVYKHFGKEIIAKKLGIEEGDALTEKMYLKMYKKFIEAVDGVDNGVTQYAVEKGAVPLYENNTSLSSRVGNLNPDWNDKFDAETQMTQFLKAVKLTGAEFDEKLDWYARVWLPARVLVEEAISKAKETHESAKILKLEKYTLWKDHLYELENDLSCENQFEFVLFEDEGAKKWRVSTIPITSGSFDNRKSLNKDWAGLRDQELSDKSGIPGCVFVHNGLFIGGNDTYEGALEMAVKSL
jgi:uncharacterized UPF0160 family protein